MKAVAARILRVAGMLFGGSWTYVSYCGSRSHVSESSVLRSHVDSVNGGRGAN